jgi:regulator of replication initiation timing
VKPGILEHLEQLSGQVTSSEKQFTAYKTRLSAVRTAKEQLQIEGKNIKQFLQRSVSGFV